MAPTSFSFLTLNERTSHENFLSVLQQLALPERPIYVGKCHHWIHAPHLSSNSLGSSNSVMRRWDYLLIMPAPSMHSLALAQNIEALAEDKWTVTAEVEEAMLLGYVEAQRKRTATPQPLLPIGWQPSNHQGLDEADPPTDVELALGNSSYPLGARTDEDGRATVLKDFVRDFGSKYCGPVNMLNLLSYFRDQRPRYFEYRAAFAKSVGSTYGGEAMFFGANISRWSSKNDDLKSMASGTSTIISDPQEAVGWEDIGLVYYPSIWHFAKMLDDPGYMDADRQFKRGVTFDNPIMCCTAVDLGV